MQNCQIDVGSIRSNFINLIPIGTFEISYNM